MVIPSFRDQSVNIGSASDVLDKSSYLIQSWQNGLREFFFGPEGILVNQRINSSQERSYLDLNCSYVLAHHSLLKEEEVHIVIMPYKLCPEEGLAGYLEKVKKNAENLMQTVMERNNEKNRTVCLKINEKLFPAKSLNLSAFIQLLASLLRLYKDVLACSSSVLENKYRQILKEALEKLPERRCEEGACNALKEMFVQAKIWISTCAGEEDRLMLVPQKINTLLIHLIEGLFSIHREGNSIRLPAYKDLSEEEFMNWLQDLSDTDFVKVVEENWEILPIISLQKVLRKKSKNAWKIILNNLSIPLLRVIPLDLLQQVLMEESNKNLFKCVLSMPLEMLVSILQEMPKNLLSKILLELPLSIVYDLKQSMSYMSLGESLLSGINENLSELQLIQKMNQLSLKDSERPISSLLSLSAIAICKLRKQSAVVFTDKDKADWGPAYVEMLLSVNSEMKEELLRYAEVRFSEPEGDPILVFERSPELEYSKEHDLFPLAAMLPGYNIFISRALVGR
ncbi:hypothetical protein CLAVI_000314 [Candidatus Clavichlamydia salmonicola]|uniref:hypothetical protein n=1 Tax=Candidatus Clavichlamydia salmonicola TaxID=469812 RepID=UPI001891BC6E|nr:hypothetical protein [Candidatus Clavichlamydia salmonicola]MBF5050699.1 hypothetical protein [Candidatus Clavichlamydia salmonicola]